MRDVKNGQMGTGWWGKVKDANRKEVYFVSNNGLWTICAKPPQDNTTDKV